MSYTTDISGQLDPELAKAFSTLPPRDPNLSPEQRRGMTRKLAAEFRKLLPPLDDIRIRDHRMPGLDGNPDVPVRVFSPSHTTATRVLLWMHGGGFVNGHHEDEDLIVAPWVRELDIHVISVGYRKPPEHPWPAATDDCWSVLNGLASILPNAQRIAIGGISAGACLATATAIRARDEHGPELCFQLLLVPCTDNRSNTPSMMAIDDRRQWHRQANIAAWKMYVGGDGPVAATAAPARAESLAGLPPTYIEVAGADPLRDEAMTYAARLIEDDVATELHVFPGAYHASTYLQPNAAISIRARREATEVLRRALVSDFQP